MVQIADYISRINYIKSILPYVDIKKSIKLFTIPEIFKRESDENFISDYLAFILDPKKNGIGAEPLKRIISYCNPEYDVDRLEFKRCSVERGKYLDEENRIDLLITIGKYLIVAIENKIYSKERENQTIDYYNAIDRAYKDIDDKLFILLAAEESTKPSSEYFKLLTYSKLYEIFSTIRPDFTNNIKHSILFDDFLLHIRRMFMSENDSLISEKTKIYLQNIEMFKDLLNSYYSESELLFNIFERATSRNFPDRFLIKWNDRYQQMYKKEWDRGNIFVHYEFWINREDVIEDNKFKVMIDVEGKNKKSFYDKFKDKYQENEKYYKERSIEYRPDKKRKIAVAYKEYNDIVSKIDFMDIEGSINKFIKEVYEEFIVFEEWIDECLKE
jgi:hypothetical protein